MAVRRTKTGQARSEPRKSSRESLRTLKLALDHQETAVLLIQNDQTVAYLNAAAESLLKTSDHFAVGNPVALLFSDPAMDVQPWEQVGLDEVPISNRSARLILKDGSTLYADYHVNPILDSNAMLIELHEMNRLIRIGRDDQFATSQETTKRLVRGLAHEVKNPLGGIRGAAQLLQRQLEKWTAATTPEHGFDGDLTEYTEVIIAEADRLSHLVDRMLGPNQKPNMEPTNIHSVLSHVVHLVTAEADSGLHWRRDFDPSLPDISADPDQLVQALLNMLRNAVQAMVYTDEPTISLRTRIVRQFTIGNERHRMVLRLDIQDNGPGIPAELQDRIFYPMITGRAEGTGLGLAITQSIIAQHQGLLEVESRPGDTRFSVFLPLTQTDIQTEVQRES